jgi:hypothetical protein
MSQDEDALDCQILNRLILMQAVEDYVRLAHPSRRARQAPATAWVTAAALIFDQDFTIAVPGIAEEVAGAELIMAATDRENVDLEHFRNEIAKQMKAYWNTKDPTPDRLPKNLVINGKPYLVLMQEQSQIYKVDYDHLTIYLTNEQPLSALFQAIAEITAADNDLRISAGARSKLISGLLETLRFNEMLK